MTDIPVNDTTFEEIIGIQQEEQVADFGESNDPRPELNSFSCGICKELMYRPVTLLCQHSYCYLCLETYYLGDPRVVDPNYPDVVYYTDKKNKCPLCNIPYTLPPMENALMSDVLEHRFPKEYTERRQYVEHTKLIENKSIEEEKKMRKEIWNIISTNFSTRDPPRQQQVPTINNITRYEPSWNDRFETFKVALWTYVPIIPVMGVAMAIARGVDKMMSSDS